MIVTSGSVSSSIQGATSMNARVCMRCRVATDTRECHVGAWESDPHFVITWLCCLCVAVCREGRAVVQEMSDDVG